MLGPSGDDMAFVRAMNALMDAAGLQYNQPIRPMWSRRRERCMAANMARKRAEKANRRKAALASRRRDEVVEGSLAARVSRAAATPIRHCLMTANLFEIGIGTVLLARGATRSAPTIANFLVDVHCLGVKDLMFSLVGADEFERLLDRMGQAAALVPAEPAHARKLLRDLNTWAGSIGFAPPADFAVVERLFGDVDADSCDADFRFGRDGRPFYVPGPSESPMQVRRRIEHLRRKFGETGFAVGA
jgi:hypothetical protein